MLQEFIKEGKKVASGIVLKVPPDELIQQAHQVQEEINQLEREWTNIRNIVLRSKSYWPGKASQKHQKYYQSIQKDTGLMIRRLKEHPKDLLQMANLYEKAEEIIEERSKGLPDEIIH